MGTARSTWCTSVHAAGAARRAARGCDAAIAQFVRPGGRLLVIARARDDGTPSSGPPWPLSRQELMDITAHGLSAETIERLPDPTDGKSHWRAAFRRA